MKHVRVFRDKNHPQIVKELKDAGYKVIDLAAVGNSVPDILVADIGSTKTALIEIKMPDGRFYLGQLEFLAEWSGLCGFAQTSEDVVQVLEGNTALDWYQRTAIMNVVDKLRSDEFRDQKQPRIAVKKFETLWRVETERLLGLDMEMPF